jgi:hypothetical protein
MIEEVLKPWITGRDLLKAKGKKVKNKKLNTKQKKQKEIEAKRVRKINLVVNNRTAVNNQMITGFKVEPFRISDDRMVMGEHKGKKYNELPLDYIQWMLDNMNLASTHKSMLIKLLK